jgi:hypothetical protein
MLTGGRIALATAGEYIVSLANRPSITKLNNLMKKIR